MRNIPLVLVSLLLLAPAVSADHSVYGNYIQCGSGDHSQPGLLGTAMTLFWNTYLGGCAAVEYTLEDTGTFIDAVCDFVGAC